MQSNWLDRAIGQVSPRWALQRARARVALTHTERTAQRFRYEGARSGRRTDGWNAGASDANVELMGALVWLRDRSRDLVRNNPYAVKAIEELVGNTVGTGITPQANTGNEELDRIIDNEWPYFAEMCDTPQRMDFYAMQALVTRTMAESGEAIVRFRPRFPQDKLRIPLQLQLLEADYLDHNRTLGTVNGNILQGVEFDQIGRRTAYWLFTQHPGGALINPRGGILSQPVPADQVMHVYRMLRPGQVRGVPWLAPVMLAMKDLDDYADSHRVAQKISACLAGIITQPGEETLGATTTDPQTGQLLESFEPGMIARLKPGEDVRFLQPHPTTGYREYKITELQALSSGTGVPYEMLASDMSATTYSSWRGGQLAFRNTIENYRWLSLSPLFNIPVWRRFIDTLVLIGKIPAKAASNDAIRLYGCNWIAPRWESVDPLKDSKAELQKMRSGTENLFSAIAAQGMDPRDQLEQIAKVNRELDRLGIVLDSDPRQTSIRGVGQPGDAGEIKPTKSGAPAPKTAKADVNDGDDDEEDIERFDIRPNRSWDSPVRTFRT